MRLHSAPADSLWLQGFEVKTFSEVERLVVLVFLSHSRLKVKVEWAQAPKMLCRLVRVTDLQTSQGLLQGDSVV